MKYNTRLQTKIQNKQLLTQQKRLISQQQERFILFDNWKKGHDIHPDQLKHFFGNKVENFKIIEPITLEKLSPESGFLLGNHIFHTKTIKNYIMTPHIERLLAQGIPGSPDKEEFIITLLGTAPINPITRQPISKFDAEIMYHQLYEGTTLSYGEHINRIIQTRNITKTNRSKGKTKKKHKPKKSKPKKSKPKKSKKNLLEKNTNVE